ncbi:MAG: hypothetical protein JXR46_02280 [Calditrichaceae bacterium]|nr:hypothetical protein [Calditrichaceae bacterium]MBN2707849.1 hypothetical protein [Calditrichaceae bacterium]
MEHKGRHFLDAKVVLGLFIIVAGALMLLDNFGYYTGFTIWKWWPLILIILGLGQILQPKESRQTWTGGFLLILGLLFLGDNLRIIIFGFWDIWPIILIFIGVMILRHHVWRKDQAHDGNNTFINLFFFLGGGDHSYSTHKLEGGSLNAIMGGGKIDLREASIVGDALIIEVFIIWGGIELFIPKDWQVNVQGMPIMGGIDNKTSTALVSENGAGTGKSGKRLIVKGLVIMGGLEIKN